MAPRICTAGRMIASLSCLATAKRVSNVPAVAITAIGAVIFGRYAACGQETGMP